MRCQLHATPSDDPRRHPLPVKATECSSSFQLPWGPQPQQLAHWPWLPTAHQAKVAAQCCAASSPERGRAKSHFFMPSTLQLAAAMLQPFPHFNSRVYRCNNDADEAREWGLARCGHHPCADGRAARHIGSNPPACCLCGSAQCSLEHLLAECSGTADLRSAWLRTHALDEATVAAPELVWLALSSGQMPARFVAANVRFVARSVLRLRRSQSQRR